MLSFYCSDAVIQGGADISSSTKVWQMGTVEIGSDGASSPIGKFGCSGAVLTRLLIYTKVDCYDEFFISSIFFAD